ncbi:MAG: TlpA family protein disulfide reductase [Elusimicrobia bacterium]|nr:TlpA family protein disulfide reductase [Elusimicrobiota bacterium]
MTTSAGRSLALAAALVLGACARKAPGAPAPDVGLPELMQAPLKDLPSLSSLRGKVVVLDFWATWCPGCVDTMPHMNKLAAKFAGRPVVFLSVTDEDRPTVERFLTTHPMLPWIGRDPDDRMFRAFGVRGIPQTFVIDPYGRVRLKISPSWLYASDIEDALRAPPPEPAKA